MTDHSPEWEQLLRKFPELAIPDEPGNRRPSEFADLDELDQEAERQAYEQAGVESAPQVADQVNRAGAIDAEYQRLEAGYVQAVAENPHYRFESAEEAEAFRTRARRGHDDE